MSNDNKIPRRVVLGGLGTSAALALIGGNQLAGLHKNDPYQFNLENEAYDQTQGAPNLFQTSSTAYGNEQQARYAEIKDAIDAINTSGLKALLLKSAAQDLKSDEDKAVIAKALAYTLAAGGKETAKADIIKTILNTVPPAKDIIFITHKHTQDIPDDTKTLVQLIQEGYRDSESQQQFIKPDKALGDSIAAYIQRMPKQAPERM